MSCRRLYLVQIQNLPARFTDVSTHARPWRVYEKLLISNYALPPLEYYTNGLSAANSDDRISLLNRTRETHRIPISCLCRAQMDYYVRLSMTAPRMFPRRFSACRSERSFISSLTCRNGRWRFGVLVCYLIEEGHSSRQGNRGRFRWNLALTEGLLVD